MKKVIIFAAILITIYIGTFYIPERVDKYALNPEKITEAWRFGTYQFIHLNKGHLLENIIGLGLIAFIAKELKTSFSNFSTTYLSSGFLSVIPIWLIIPFIALGASNAIFGGFGFLSQETEKYGINKWLIITVLTGLTFMNTITSYFTYGYGSEEFKFALKQGGAHFSGLIFGIVAFFGIMMIKPIITKRKRHILRRGGA